jgi:hypothetical protein
MSLQGSLKFRHDCCIPVCHASLRLCWSWGVLHTMQYHTLTPTNFTWVQIHRPIIDVMHPFQFRATFLGKM